MDLFWTVILRWIILYFFSLWYLEIASLWSFVALSFNNLWYISSFFFTTFPFSTYSKLLNFTIISIIIFHISDSMVGAVIFHPCIDKLFHSRAWTHTPYFSLSLLLSLLLPDASLQLLWLTANSFITGHKHQVLHLKGHPTHPTSLHRTFEHKWKIDLQE